MKFALIILVIVMGLPWCGCSTATAKSNIDIPSTQFTATQGEALGGDAVAQFRLGEWYRTGEEVKRNTAQAYAWFTISARNGYPLAEARVRAAWSRATIARGKELAEILIDKYPSVVFIP
jgi:hypothetical protein